MDFKPDRCYGRGVPAPTTPRQDELAARRRVVAEIFFDTSRPLEERLKAKEELEEIIDAEMWEECPHGKTAWSFCWDCDGGENEDEQKDG